MWHSFRPKNSAWYRWRLNGATAYLRRDRDSWRVAFDTIPFSRHDDDFGGPEEAPPPEGLRRIHARGSGESVFLHPFLSREPYSINLRGRLRIAPGGVCRLAVALPPILRFEQGPENVLAEWTPFSTAMTFHGANTMSGEICHSIEPALDDDDEKEDAPSALIRCDLLVKNGARATLEPDRVVVRPGPLSVYVHRGRLVADALELEYTETDCRPRVSKIADAGHRLVSAGARYSAGESLARRGVDIIKDIATI